MVRTVDTRPCAIMAMSIISTMVICITFMKIISTNMLSKSARPTRRAARLRPGALTRMGQTADMNACRTAITSITSSMAGCTTHMTDIAMIMGR
jgi:hypothetical protein